MYRIRRFGVIRTATVVAVAYAIGFAILAIPLAFIALAAPRGAFAMAAIVPAMLFALLVVYPLLIWVFTAIACLIYNLVARWLGGIEVEIERLQPPGSAPYGYPGYGQTSGPAPWTSGQGQWPPGPGQWPPGQWPGQPPAAGGPGPGQYGSPPGSPPSASPPERR